MDRDELPLLTYLNPLAWMRWCGEFASLWMLSIPWRRAPKALPALLVLLALSACAIAARAGLAGWRNQRVAYQLAESFKADDFETAELLLRRQLAERPDDANLVYKLALVRENRQAHDEAVTLMQQLVRVKQHQHAARWLLDKHYFQEPWGSLSEDERDQVGTLLGLVHRESPKDLAVTAAYADYSIARGNLPRAVELLEQLAPVQPMQGFRAAVFSRQLGNETTATRLASDALRRVTAIANEDPSNGRLWLAVAQCHLFLHHHAEAVATLEQAVPRAGSAEQAAELRQALGDSIVAWIGYIEQSPNETPKERLRVLQMLQSALQYAPNNPRVVMLVADQVLKTIDDEDEAVQATREALIAGTSPGIAHFIQGTAAMIRDDVETAEMHLTIAADQLPESGAILNNLAVALAARPDADLEKALRVSQTAIEKTPNATPHYYETRGQILLKMKRYLKAVPDLERALAVESLAAGAHRALAECYKQLGQEELAREHAKAAEK